MTHFSPLLSVISKISLSAERSEIGVGSCKNLGKMWTKTVAVRKRKKDCGFVRNIESTAFGIYCILCLNEKDDLKMTSRPGLDSWVGISFIELGNTQRGLILGEEIRCYVSILDLLSLCHLGHIAIERSSWKV